MKLYSTAVTWTRGVGGGDAGEPVSPAPGADPGVVPAGAEAGAPDGGDPGAPADGGALEDLGALAAGADPLTVDR